jgi:hypothetical protein
MLRGVIKMLIHHQRKNLETNKCNLHECRKRLVRGDRLNHNGFIQEVGDHRLSASIFTLRNPHGKYGWNICDIWIRIYNPATQRMDRRKEYYLPDAEIERIKKEAQNPEKS